MRARFIAIAIALTVIGGTVASPSLADQGKAPATVPQAVEGEGVIRAIDRSAGSITLKHDPITALGWPAMTMAFPVQSPDMLKDLVVGQRVHFVLMNHGGKPMVSEIQAR